MKTIVEIGILGPIHRQYLTELERALIQIDPEVVMPYWPWSIYSDEPSLDPLWDTFSRDGEGNCITDGVLGAESILTVPYTHCLKRGIDATGPHPGSFVDQPTLGNLIANSSSFWSFAKTLNIGAHLNVHGAIGGSTGDMGRLRFASNDPIFWLCHAYLNIIWNDWQASKPDYINMYDGPGANISEKLFPYNVNVGDVLSTSGLCYAYRQPGSKWEGQLNAPSAQQL